MPRADACDDTATATNGSHVMPLKLHGEMAAASQVAKNAAAVDGIVRARLKARSAPTSEASAPAAKERMTERRRGVTGGMAANCGRSGR